MGHVTLHRLVNGGCTGSTRRAAVAGVRASQSSPARQNRRPIAVRPPSLSYPAAPSRESTCCQLLAPENVGDHSCRSIGPHRVGFTHHADTTRTIPPARMKRLESHKFVSCRHPQMRRRPS